MQDMIVLVKGRFFRKWICICMIVVVFVLGNYFLFNSRNEYSAARPILDERPTSVEFIAGTVEDVDPIILLTGNEKTVKNKGNGHISEKESMFITKSNSEIGNWPKEAGGEKGKIRDFKYKLAVVVIACNRPSVNRCLDQIFNLKPHDIDIPVIVSQDCGHKETENVIRSYGDQLTLVKQPDLSDVQGVPNHMLHFMGYYKISRHYKFALQQAFKDSNVDSVIIVEDDLNIAPDFFEYFLATRPLLDMDKSIFCISAWNDNGKEGFVKDNKLLYRTDFFPGLGWMLTRELWNELKLKWPLGFWDDWMRSPEQRKNRACIRPEISRSKTFGRVGVSQGQFYDQYLKFIKLNSEFYPFTKTDLRYLLKANYDEKYIREVKKKPIVTAGAVLSESIQDDAVRIQYSSNSEIESLTRQFELMTDLKAGVPRTAYKGIISFVRKNKRIYLTPVGEWSGYD